MADYCQCLRCGKRIPIRPELIGQTILCPSCLERVYVTPAGQAPEKPKVALSAGAAEPTMSPSAAAALARLKSPNEEERSLPIGVIAGVGGVAALVIIVGLIMWSSNSAKKPGPQAGAPLPPPPPGAEAAPEQSGPAMPQYPAMPSPESKLARPAGPAMPPNIPSNYAATPGNYPATPSNYPATPGNYPAVSSPATPPAAAPAVATPAGSVNPVSLTSPPQSLGSNWAEVWRLPTTPSSEPTALASIVESPMPWRIAVRSATPDIRTAPSVVLEPESDPRAWMLKHLPNPLAIADKEPIAMFRQDGPNLVFAWATPLASEQARRHALNSVLDVSAGSVRRVGQLREPIRMEPIALDVAGEKQTIEAQIDDPPRADALRLEITELSGFPTEINLRNGVKTAMAPSATGAMPMAPSPFGPAPIPGAPRPAVPTPGIPSPAVPASGFPASGFPAAGSFPGLGMPMGQPTVAQTLVIESEDIPGLEIRVKLAKAESTGKVTISIDPVLNEGPSAVFDLATPKILDRLEQEVERPLQNAQRELAPAEASLKRWQADAEKLKGNEPRTRDIQRHTKWRLNVAESEAWASKFGKEVEDLKKKIETYQTRIEVVAKLRPFLKDAHKQALIHYVVYTECGQPDVLLIDARGER